MRTRVFFLCAVLACLLAVPVRAGEAVDPDEAPILLCQRVICGRAMVIDLVKPSVLEAAPADKLPFWNALLPALTESLSGRHAEAIAQFAELASDYPRETLGDTTHAFLMRLNGVVLGKSGDFAGAVRAYDAMLDQYGGSSSPAVRRQVVFVMSHRAFTLGEGGDFDAQQEAFRELVEKYKTSADATVRYVVAGSWFNMAKAYDGEGLGDDARRTFNAMRAGPGCRTLPKTSGN